MHSMVKLQGPALHGDPVARLHYQGVQMLVAGKIKGWDDVHQVG